MKRSGGKETETSQPKRTPAFAPTVARSNATLPDLFHRMGHCFDSSTDITERFDFYSLEVLQKEVNKMFAAPQGIGKAMTAFP